MAPIEFTEEQLADCTSEYYFRYSLGEQEVCELYYGFMNEKRIAIKAYFSSFKFARDRWENEKARLAELEHPNIIEFIGYAEDEDRERLYMVYEYMPCTVTSVVSVIEWSLTLKILREVASVLYYIHKRSHPSLVLGNLKLNDIFLDEKHNIKVSAFGTLIQDRHWISNRHLRSAAPETIYRGKATPSSDIYSLGVIILQLILKIVEPTNEIRINESYNRDQSFIKKHVVAYAHKEFRRRKDLVSEVLRWRGCSRRDAIKIKKLGIQCTDDDPSRRPSIVEVIDILGQLQVQDSQPLSDVLLDQLTKAPLQLSDMFLDQLTKASLCLSDLLLHLKWKLRKQCRSFGTSLDNSVSRIKSKFDPIRVEPESEVDE